jgi:hypothetical protein
VTFTESLLFWIAREIAPLLILVVVVGIIFAGALIHAWWTKQ